MDLLDRASAFEALDGWLADVRAGRGRVVLVSGEAGVGKTSLVSEFVDRHRAEAEVLIGGCDPLTTPRPLGPLADVATAMGGPVAELLRDEAPRAVLFSGVLERLRRARRVVALVVEDLHWADEATTDLLRFLARRITHARVLILATFRDDEASPAPRLRLLLGDLAGTATVRRLPLVPLSGAAVAVLARGSGIDPDRLYAMTGGNPFYVTEVLAAGGEDVPVTVIDAVLARAARLSARARQVLDAAAVVASPVEIWLVAAAADAAGAHLDECVAAGMLREQAGGVAFRHELARLAVESALPPGRRVELHRKVLAALLARPPEAREPARLAHHGEAAGDASAVLAYAPAAARRAAALGAHREAADQYARALRFAEGLLQVAKADLLDRHSYECYLVNRSDEAISSRRLAIDHWRAVGDRRRTGDSLRWLSRLSWIRGDSDEAERASRTALELLENEPPGPELAMAYSNLAQLRMLAGDTYDAMRWGGQAIELAERLGRADILAHALNNVGTAEILVDPAAGRAKLARSLALARTESMEEHVARALNNLASVCLMQRDYAAADRWLAEGIAYCTERDLDTWRLHMLAGQARSDLDVGRWPEAAQRAELVLRHSQATPATRIPALIVGGLVRARRGEPDVWPLLDEALAVATEAGELQRHGPVAAARAEAAWLDGRADRELPLVERAIDSVSPPTDPDASWQLGELAFWRWRAGGPRTVHADAAGPFALQLAGDWAAAAGRWRELGWPYEAACAQAENDQPAALRTALAALRQLGARPAAAMASRRLRQHGVRGLARGPRPTTSSNPAGLTVRELEVLVLLTEGLRNAEIAGRLFISARTVDRHVSAILAKLGAQTRAQAARSATRLGLVGT